MYNQYSNFEELRPTGEASHIPDTKLNDECDGDPRRQRVATSTGGYPDAPRATDGECRSCGASIRDEQTKCRFCLTNHLSSETSSTDESVTTTFLGIVHLVVEPTAFYGAAANLLTANEAEPAVEDYTLLYDLDETPAPQLADRCPSLLVAVQVASAEGEQLLAAAQDRTGWNGQGTVGAPVVAPDAALRPVGTASAMSCVSERSSTTPTTRLLRDAERGPS